MRVTSGEIAAFADGELSGEREAAMAAAVASDPDLARQVEQHRALAARLAGHYAPVLDAPVPDRLADLLKPRPVAEVVDFAAARDRREARSKRISWGWIAAPALAASLTLAVILGDPGNQADAGGAYADPQLASVLDDRLVADQSPVAETRVLLSFRNEGGSYCRAFSGDAGGGIACRDERGWKLDLRSEGSEAGSTDYRMAGAGDGAILAEAQEMAAGPALDAQAEREARERGWR